MTLVPSYTTDAERWHAVQTRDSAATGHFVYAVRTTGVYCQPACSSRLAKRQNVEFFNDAHQAEAAGYRACKRCAGGTQAATPQPVVARACRLIEASDRHLTSTS
jgi:AraC family transcriptional regulator of adaptative response/methylated-DNA-[protein]-cysteine methyltransferase